MQRAELIEIMSDAQKIMLLNKEALPISLINQIEDALLKLKEPALKAALGTLFGEVAETAIVSLEKVLDIEKKLLVHAEGKSCMSDRLYQSLENLKHRPVILSMIATCI